MVWKMISTKFVNIDHYRDSTAKIRGEVGSIRCPIMFVRLEIFKRGRKKGSKYKTNKRLLIHGI